LSVIGRPDVLTLPATAGGKVRVHPLVFHQVLDLLDVPGWQIRRRDNWLRALIAGPGAGFNPTATQQAVQAVHLGALAGALLLIGGLVALRKSLGLRPATSAAWARLATAAAVTAAAAYGLLQVVDGVALKRAVDARVAAAVADRTAAFVAAQTVRWIEYGP
jgi:hypothetical protein